MRKSEGAGDTVAAVTPDWCGMGKCLTHLWDSVSPCDVFRAGWCDPGVHGCRVVKVRLCLQRRESSCSNRNGPDLWTSVGFPRTREYVSQTSECISWASMGISRMGECISQAHVSHGRVCLMDKPASQTSMDVSRTGVGVSWTSEGGILLGLLHSSPTARTLSLTN